MRTRTLPLKTVAMLQSHTHSVFFVLFDAQKFNEATMERVAGCNNVITLLCLHEPEITTEACRAANAMRSKQMFYGFLVEMGRADAAQAVNTDWLVCWPSMACSALYQQAG